MIALAALVQDRSLQPLATLSFCLGASAIAPALVYSLFWRRFTRTGLLSTLIGGSLSVLLLMPGTRLVSGSPTSAFPDADFDWFPFTTTGWCPSRWASPSAGSAACSQDGAQRTGNANGTRPSRA
ncbi:hypothetical protein [Streptomyces avermitilis]|uniref:hypothetical protein n=1 Tax=Streptomyces avermitilis TaxID=33903 RepID=UPI00351D9540